MNRHLLRFLDAKKTALFLCDIQEKFRPAMPLFDCLLQNSTKLLEGTKALEVPLFVTEQYPEKLGKIDPALDISHAMCVVPKTRFSMLEPDVISSMEEVYCGMPSDVVLFGIEAHVCVEQTAIDLLKRDINVFVVADCALSRTNQDRDMAFRRLSQYGCVLATYESILFNLLNDKNNPKFPELLKIVKEKASDMDLAWACI